MMSAERGAAENSLQAYGRDLQHYVAFLEARGGALLNASSDDIRAYLASLEEHGFARTTAARRLSAVRQFHQFMHGEGLVSANPAAIVESPKAGRPLPKMLSTQDIDLLLAEAQARVSRAEGKARFKAERLYCLLELLAATGLRVSELVGLTVRAVTADDAFLAIKGKGGRERLVPVSDRARSVLQAYLKTLALREAAETKWLFPSHGASGCLTRQHFAIELKALAARLRPGPWQGFTARAAPRLCQLFAGMRGGPAGGSANAGACGYFDHPDLHPCPGGAPAGSSGDSPSFS